MTVGTSVGVWVGRSVFVIGGSRVGVGVFEMIVGTEVAVATGMFMEAGEDSVGVVVSV